MSSRFQLTHAKSGKVVAVVLRAESAWEKGWGVIPWRDLPRGHGLWLPGVSAVHTVFVKFSLDLLFLDQEFRTLRVVEDVKPWTWLVAARGAAHTIELGTGTVGMAGISLSSGERWTLTV